MSNPFEILKEFFLQWSNYAYYTVQALGEPRAAVLHLSPLLYAALKKKHWHGLFKFQDFYWVKFTSDQCALKCHSFWVWEDWSSSALSSLSVLQSWRVPGLTPICVCVCACVCVGTHARTPHPCYRRQHGACFSTATQGQPSHLFFSPSAADGPGPFLHLFFTDTQGFLPQQQSRPAQQEK